MAKTWQTGRYGHERYVDEDGKVLADVEDSSVSIECTATVRFVGSLGAYVSRDAARRAVERHFAPGVAPTPELLVWEFTGIAGLKRFLTQAQYEAQTHDTQKWYRPICQKCGPSGVDLPREGEPK